MALRSTSKAVLPASEADGSASAPDASQHQAPRSKRVALPRRRELDRRSIRSRGLEAPGARACGRGRSLRRRSATAAAPGARLEGESATHVDRGARATEGTAPPAGRRGSLAAPGAPLACVGAMRWE